MSNVPPPPPPGGGFPPPPPPGGGFTPPPPAGGGFTPPAQGYSAPGGGYTPSGGYGAPRASFGARLGAAIIDGIITSLFWIPGVIYLFVGPTKIDDCPDTDSFEPGDICEVPTGSTLGIAIALWVAALIAMVIYWSKLDGNSQTVGKKALGIRVVDATTGQPIGTGRGVGRFFSRQFLSGAVCALGYLWMLWDDQKQTWHDKIVSSVVVRDQ